jgi:hypothetical protein
MRLFVALRLLSEQHAKLGVEACSQDDRPRGKLIDANVTRHHPALKNISSFLASTGFLPETRKGLVLRSEAGEKQIDREADFRLYWCEIETELDEDYWYSQREVEAVIAKDEFTKFAASIRHKAGAAYVEACEKYAQSLRINIPGQVGYEPPRTSRHRAA